MLICNTVDTIIWLENNVFFAIYTQKSEDNDDIHTPYIVDRKAPEDEKYVLMDEVLPILAMEYPNEYFYIAVVRNIGPEAKTAIILANSAATELNVVGQGDDGKWATWMMDHVPSLPLSIDDVDDTYPVGLTVDYSASEPLPPFDLAEDDTPVPPMPVLYMLTTDGLLLSYHIYNENLAKSGTKCEEMVEAKDLSTIPAPQKSVNATAFGNTESKIPSFNSLNKSEKSPNAFGATSSTSSSYATFGSSGFGSSNGASSKPFSSLARSSSTETKLPQPVSAFGSTSTFGQPSGFGQPTFGSTTAFGSSSSFGSVSSNMSQVTSPSFGGFTGMVKNPKKSNSAKSDKPFADTSFAPSTLESDTSASTDEKPLNFSDEKSTPSSNQSTYTFGQKPTSAFGTPSVFGQNPFGPTSFTSTPSSATLKSKDSENLLNEPVRNTKREEEEVISEEPNQDNLPKPTDDGVVPESPKDVITDKSKDSSASEKEKKGENTNNNKENEQEATASIVQAATEADQQASLTPKEEKYDAGCSMSVEQVEKSLEETDVDVCSGSEFSKTDSNQDDKEGYENGVNSEDDYFDEEDQTNSEEESDDNEEKKPAAEANRKLEQERTAENERIAKEKRIQEENKLEEERIANEKRIAKEQEEKRIAEEKRITEEKRIAEEKRVEEERIAKEKRLEEERIAEEERLEAERLAAIKPNLKFSVMVKNDEELEPYERSKGLPPMAAEFEDIYFSTLEDMESVSNLAKEEDI